MGARPDARAGTPCASTSVMGTKNRLIFALLMVMGCSADAATDDAATHEGALVTGGDTVTLGQRKLVYVDRGNESAVEFKVPSKQNVVLSVMGSAQELRVTTASGYSVPIVREYRAAGPISWTTPAIDWKFGRMNGLAAGTYRVMLKSDGVASAPVVITVDAATTPMALVPAEGVYRITRPSGEAQQRVRVEHASRCKGAFERQRTRLVDAARQKHEAPRQYVDGYCLTFLDGHLGDWSVSHKDVVDVIVTGAGGVGELNGERPAEPVDALEVVAPFERGERPRSWRIRHHRVGGLDVNETAVHLTRIADL